MTFTLVCGFAAAKRLKTTALQQCSMLSLDAISQLIHILYMFVSYSLYKIATKNPNSATPKENVEKYASSETINNKKINKSSSAVGLATTAAVPALMSNSTYCNYCTVYPFCGIQ